MHVIKGMISLRKCHHNDNENRSFTGQRYIAQRHMYIYIYISIDVEREEKRVGTILFFMSFIFLFRGRVVYGLFDVNLRSKGSSSFRYQKDRKVPRVTCVHIYIYIYIYIESTQTRPTSRPVSETAYASIFSFFIR
jgi:hypothetical protein